MIIIQGALLPSSNFIRLLYPNPCHKASITSIYFLYDYHTLATLCAGYALRVLCAARQKFVLVCVGRSPRGRACRILGRRKPPPDFSDEGLGSSGLGFYD
jgi:hypothetical protein